MGVRLATGPVTWGVDFADSPNNPPWTSVLDDIQRSGLGASNSGRSVISPRRRTNCVKRWSPAA